MITRPSRVLVASATVLAGAVWLHAAAASPQLAKVTFSETIAPIVYDHCVTCHRPGEAAPFSLITYDDVAKRGALIAQVTGSRYMPPWHAAHGYGEFADERRLTDAQIADIAAWVKQGMPKGDANKLPPVPQFTEGWQLGTPDLVLQMAEPYTVAASGPDVYRNFAIPTGLTEDKWVRAVEYRPAARRVVHHAIFMFVRGGAVASLEGAGGQPGFGGVMPASMIPAFAPSGDLGGWAVGTTPRFLTDGLAWPLAKGSDFVLQLHLHPTGKPEVERSTIGIYFARNAPERKLREMGTPGLFGLLSGIDIPPGEKHYTITGSLKMFVDMRAFSVMAHAHYLGKEIKATATLPDGSVQPLLWIQDWNFNWQDRYTYKEPVLLPKGTKIDVSITYDNSAENPHNPCHPPRRVQWGVQSFDEMGGVRFQMVPVSQADEAAMQQMVAAVAKSLGNQLAQNDTVKRLQDQQRQQQDQYIAAAARGDSGGCGAPSGPGVPTLTEMFKIR